MTTTASVIQQDFGLDARFSAVREDFEENMSESCDSSTSSQIHVSGSLPQSTSNENVLTTEMKDDDPNHVYTNIREIEEMNRRPVPPTPKENAVPKRDLLNGWFEYETDVGRTFFFNKETGKSQWIPPRFIRTPQQIQEFLRVTRSEIDEKCTYEGTSSVSSEEQKENRRKDSKDIVEERKSQLIEDEEVFDEVCDEVQESVHHHPESDSFSDDFEDSDMEEGPSREPMPHPNPSEFHAIPDPISPYMIPPDCDAPCPVESTKVRRPSPTSLRSSSFQSKCAILKNMPIPQVSAIPSMPDRPFVLQDELEGEQLASLMKWHERRGSSEGREPVRTIRCGDMERSEQKEDLAGSKVKKREWLTNYMYLTSAHLILYKDQKSAEKHGKHYDAPLGVWDLRGAKLAWQTNDSKKKRRYIQLELLNTQKYLLRTSTESETIEWFKALDEVVANLPIPGPSAQTVIDVSNTNVTRNLSYLGKTRPLSHALIPLNRSIRRRDDPMSQSAIETTSNAVVEESRPSKESILEKLRRFFRTRPTVESLKEKGIYKPEPVFGSTLSSICQIENSLVPKFIRVVTEVIESKGLEMDGIYRVSGNLSAVQKIRCQADQDNYKSLVAEEDIHVLTGALKLFFRELSEPLFPLPMHKEFTSAMQTPNVTTRFKKFEELLSRLPNENRETLKMLLRHLNRVASHSSKNRMQQHNLAIVFGPTLFHNGDGAGVNTKNKKGVKKGKTSKGGKDDQPAPVQSNSHLAFSMIMQSQIVQYLLESANKFDILKAPVNIGR